MEVIALNDFSLYQKANVADRDFPIQLFQNNHDSHGSIFDSHWHEQLEILYFIEGEAVVECSSTPVSVKPGEFIVINSNELHSGYNPGNRLSYYCFNIDTSMLQSSFPDSCEIKYISPIEKNLIIFSNKVSNDTQAVDCIASIIAEYENKEIGFEMAIKSYFYKLLVLLIRKHVKQILTQEEYDKKVKNLEKLREVLKYIEENYTEEVSIAEACKLSGLSTYYFCHLFKGVTGKTLSEYVNSLRINKAESLLKSTEMNITEIALATGFNDINYFSRLFKKNKKASPSELRKSSR